MERLNGDRGASAEPLYNIGVVTRMTGIPVATLRAWERRYGFPQAARTSGGHRLYSEDEVARLRWVKEQIDRGMQTGQAIRALMHLKHAGRFPELARPAEAIPGREAGRSTLAVFRDRLTAALLEQDVDTAGDVLGEVLALFPPEELALEVIIPSMADIGQAWLDGRISVAAEHLATHFLRHRLLMWMLTGPAPHAVRPVVLACAPGELHEGSLLVLGVLLRRRRWPVVYLGQSVPLPDLAVLVQEMKPPAVVLLAMLESSAQALAEWPRWLPEAARTGRPAIAYGGRVFTEQPEWCEKVPGTFLGTNLRDGAQRLERLLSEITGVGW